MGSGDGSEDDGQSGEQDGPSIADVLEDLPERPPPAETEPGSSDRDPPTFADLATGLDAPSGSAAGAPSGRESVESGRSAASGAGASPERSTSADGWDWSSTASRDVDLATKMSVVRELIADAANVLLLGPGEEAGELGVCPGLLAGPVPTNRVLVTFSQSPDERLQRCRPPRGESGGETVIVSVGDPARSSAEPDAKSAEDDSITVKGVTDPRDLVRLGITISRALSSFDDEERPVVACFHSLSALLRFVEDRQSVFRFLHILCGRVDAAGAMAHYHLDPSAHEERVVPLLRSLFDVTLRVEASGSVSIDGIT